MRFLTRELIFRQALSLEQTKSTMGTYVSFIFRGYDPYILGPKTPLKVLVHIHYARQNCDVGCILKGLRSFTKQEKATSSFFQSWPFDNPNGGHLTPENVTQNTQKRSLGRTWIRYFTGWWFWILFIFTPAWGNDENLTNPHIFQLGFGEKPPTRQIGGNFEGFSST